MSTVVPLLRQGACEFPQALRKLDPRTLLRSPVLLLVWLGSVVTTGAAALDPSVFTVSVAGWLWVTVLFANLAEAVAERRGRAQAASLRAARTDTVARRLLDRRDETGTGAEENVPGTELQVGDLVVVEAGSVIPSDGDIVRGIASVDESAITGESAPVIREAGGDRSAVTGGTTVLSDRIVVRISAAAGQTFLDRMIGLVEGTGRRRTPNEIALSILLTSLTLVFLVAVATVAPMADSSGAPQDLTVLVALLVCLVPTTIGALLSAIGIAGMDRLVQVNVLATSGRAVEAAGDVGTLMLDKTGTITFGNRRATRFVPAPGVAAPQLAAAARLASTADLTPEGSSIVALADAQDAPMTGPAGARDATFVPFSAQTRMSGVDLADGSQIRKGAASAVAAWTGQPLPTAVLHEVEAIASSGGTPLVIAQRACTADGTEDVSVLGAVHLKDVVKPGMADRFAQLRDLGIRTVMVTGDNALTARAIAAEAGVDDFIAEATPESKMERIRQEQQGGRLVAMTGDGTNDAPALAAADVGLAMNSGTSAAKEAGNMVDLDSDPTKLIDVVRIGKQLLITRGALTTFSLANDVAKYFAVIPAMFVAAYPQLDRLNVMGLHSPTSAILSAVVFNVLVIVALVPLALRGVRFRGGSAESVLRRNLLVYGLGGVLVPFAGIKLIDLLVSQIPGMS